MSTTPEHDDEPWCTVCDNPCVTTVSMTEESIDVDDYSWLCYNPETDSETAYLHE